MANYLMAVDAGTGSVRAVIFGTDGTQIGCVQQEWTHREDPRWPGSMDFDWKTNWALASGCIRGVLEKTGIVLVSKGSIPLNRGIEPLQAVDGGGYALPPGPAYTPEEAAADAAALEAGEKKGDAPAEDIVDVDPEDLGEAPKNTAAPRKDDVTDADVVVEDGKPRA